jgi:phosphoribosylformimino-5-aminoimidazole carboxamide ribotide isomerase
MLACACCIILLIGIFEVYKVLLIPAIDLKDGRCVRLRQGRMDDETIFSDDPVDVAKRWVDAGGRRLHLVDLNGAFAGEPVNGGVIRDIGAANPDLPIQVGGGIRDEKTIEAYLKAGVDFAIIGTQAVNEPEFVGRACKEFPGHIIVGLDAKDGMVAIDGWATITEHKVTKLAKRFEDDGVSAIVYTDIGRDGMLSGPNVEATADLANAITIPVIASGGITDISDIRALCQAETDNITGAITGRAIYEGTLDFTEGQKLADELSV